MTHTNLINFRKVCDVVRDQYPRLFKVSNSFYASLIAHLVMQYPMVSNHVVKDVAPHVRIHSTQRVVKQIDFRVLIHCSSKTVIVSKTK